MPRDTIYIPFDRELYDDIIRFSDGQISPETLADDQVRNWIERTIDNDNWGDRALEVAEKYAPDVHARWMQEDSEAAEAARATIRPLIWKDVEIRSGSKVRMTYGDQQHFAEVKGGKIVDADGEFSPSEWASKIANNTARNAWRDLWFKDPFFGKWVLADALRKGAEGESE